MMENDFLRAEALFKKTYGDEETKRLVSNGRLEIIGNHTDHQRGHCLVAGASLGIHGCLAKSDDRNISITSEGYDTYSFSIDEVKPLEEEHFTSIALAKGVVSALAKMGYHIGGFKAALTSDIFSGAGVSSSAAYELFIAEALNFLYNDEKISRLDLAKASQYAENVYFGKASGLLDQTGSSFGGLVFVDFKDPNEPVIECLSWPQEWKLHIVLVNPGASHAGLSDLYSEMPNDMKLVAKTMFDKDVLSEVDEKTFYENIYENKWSALSNRAKKRAIHYEEENNRVLRAKEAIVSKNLDYFLELERESQISQNFLLGNTMIPSHYEGSPLQAVDRAREFLHEGASRVMGGGLVGSTINFVKEDELDSFIKGMSQYYPDNQVKEVEIPSLGAHVILGDK
jgi:galactokinase